MFSRNTKKVLTILKDLTVDNYAETCMKWKRCGQEAMLILQNHSDGKSEGERSKQVAKDDLKRLFHRNDTTFSFEK